MFDSDIKLSNFCANWFEYYYRKHHNEVEMMPYDSKLSKMMDEELLQYFSVEKNVYNYINKLLIEMFTNRRQFYALNYNFEQEKQVNALLEICKNDVEALNEAVQDFTEKNLIAVNNAIEIFKEKNGGTLVVEEQNYHEYFKRKLGIKFTYDNTSTKNAALKKKIIDGRFFTDDEIKILSKFCDWGGYGWMYIWKNIDNVKVLPPQEISSGFENQKKGYVGMLSGDLITKEKLTIIVNGVKFSRQSSERISTAGFW